jgi:hypothetical protein
VNLSEGLGLEVMLLHSIVALCLHIVPCNKQKRHFISNIYTTDGHMTSFEVHAVYSALFHHGLV